MITYRDIDHMTEPIRIRFRRQQAEALAYMLEWINVDQPTLDRDHYDTLIEWSIMLDQPDRARELARAAFLAGRPAPVWDAARFDRLFREDGTLDTTRLWALCVDSIDGAPMPTPPDRTELSDRQPWYLHVFALLRNA